MNQLDSASLYTDFNGLGELRREAKESNPEAIKAVAQQFEAIFVQMMMKSMRDAKLADGLFDSDQTDQYVDLYDKQLANTLSSQGRGIGLADVIARQLSGTPQQGGQKVEAMTTNIPTRLPTLFQLRELEEVQAPVNVQGPSTVDLDSGRDVGAKSSSATSAAASEHTDPVMKTPDDFVKQLWPMAEKAAHTLGIEPKAILAQAALETGWGRSVIRDGNGDNSFNLFNIKSGSGWRGDSVSKNSLEFSDGVARQERSAFRSYADYQESFDDYVQFIKTNPRYEKALKQGGSTEEYIRELQKAGYATDPEYATKIESILKRSQFNATIDTLASNSTTDPALS